MGTVTSILNLMDNKHYCLLGLFWLIELKSDPRKPIITTFSIT